MMTLLSPITSDIHQTVGGSTFCWMFQIEKAEMYYYFHTILLFFIKILFLTKQFIISRIIILFNCKVKIFCSNYFFQQQSYQSRDAGIVCYIMLRPWQRVNLDDITIFIDLKIGIDFVDLFRTVCAGPLRANFSAQMLHTQHDKYAANAVDGHFKLAANVLLLSLKTVVMTNYLPS